MKYTAENLFLTILSLQLLLVPLFFPSSSFLILSLSPYPSSSIAFAHPDEPNVAIVAHREQKTNFGNEEIRVYRLQMHGNSRMSLFTLSE